jgi:hypothetical protein
MFNVKIVRRLLPALLVSVLVIAAAAACSSTPREKTDELDGFTYRRSFSENHYEHFKFRAGKYLWESVYISGGGSSSSETGTYTISGNEIFFVTDAGKKRLFPYVFSEDRQKFWQKTESEKFAYTKYITWAEALMGKK